jgi:hypothetical protein
MIAGMEINLEKHLGSR